MALRCKEIKVISRGGGPLIGPLKPSGGVAMVSPELLFHRLRRECESLDASTAWAAAGPNDWDPDVYEFMLSH